MLVSKNMVSSLISMPSQGLLQLSSSFICFDHLYPCLSTAGLCSYVSTVQCLVYPSMGSMKTAGGRCQCEVYSRLCIFGLNDDEDIVVDVSYTSTAIYSEGSIVVEQGVKCKRNRNDKRVVKVFSLYAMLC
nr:hypothetical protein Iba_chr10aCG17510 [Ipomoea batatas]